MTPEEARVLLPDGVGPQLIYRHSDGTTFTVVDRSPVGYHQENHTDDQIRERRICAALLRHALDLLNGEDTFNA